MSTEAQERQRTSVDHVERGLFLEPLDVLSFGDGRPSTISERVETGLPTPQPVTGAILTALLRELNADFEALATELRASDDLLLALHRALPEEVAAAVAQLRVLGPWFAKLGSDGRARLFFDAPHDLALVERNGKKELCRATPVMSSSRHPIAHCVLKPGKVTPCKGYLTVQAIERYLRSEPVRYDEIVPAAELWSWEDRVGTVIGRTTGTAEEGLLYSRRYLALREGVGLYVSLRFPPQDALSRAVNSLRLLPLGGERRYVRVRHLEHTARLPSGPEAVENPDATPILLFLTPVRPGRRNGFVSFGASEVRSVIARESFPISGWDYARRAPKPTRYALPAGTVVALSHPRPLLPNPLAEHPNDALAGWGVWAAGYVE